MSVANKKQLVFIRKFISYLLYDLHTNSSVFFL